MSEKNKKQILIKDFKLFCDVVKSTTKIIDSAKFIVNENGLAIYGARGKIARCEILSNSIYSTENIEFSILDLNMFVKILNSVIDIHNDDYTDFKFIVDLPFIRFTSKKFKTKFSTCNEDVISKWVSTKVQTQLIPIFEFKTNSGMIKRINSHQFIFNDTSNLRVYIEAKEDMEKNSIFATLGNNETNLNNEIVLKLGLLTLGAIEPNRQIVLDIERLNLFNALQSEDILISLMNMNVLVGKTKISGKNDSYFSLTIYSTILKS